MTQSKDTGKPKRAPRPTAHEMAILRRLAAPGAFLMVTLTQEGTRYVYENGEVIKNISSSPLDEKGFKRLIQWIDPVKGEAMFDGPPQRWIARKPP